MSRPTWVRGILCVLRTVLPICQSDKKKVQALDSAINLAEAEPAQPEPGPSHHVEERKADPWQGTPTVDGYTKEK